MRNHWEVGGGLHTQAEERGVDRRGCLLCAKDSIITVIILYIWTTLIVYMRLLHAFSNLNHTIVLYKNLSRKKSRIYVGGHCKVQNSKNVAILLAYTSQDH